MATPTIHNLTKDYARYGLTANEANILLGKCNLNRRGRRVVKIVLHIQDGKTWGSLRHWLGVSASANYMANRDGSLLIVIPEQHGPWTNGDVCKPQTDQVGAVPAGFWTDPNNDTITIEAEGTPWDSLTAMQLDSIEWLIRDIMLRYDLDWNDVEIDVIRHRNINSCTRPNCPGASDHNDYYLAMEKRIKFATPTTQYAMPITYPWLQSDAGINRKIGSTVVYACKRSWEVKTRTPRLRTAKMSTNTADMVGPHLEVGDTFPGEFVLFNKAGGWVLTEWGTRVFMGDLTEMVVFGEVVKP